MQRRAAAVYFVLFMVLGAGAYGFMQVGMSAPTVELDGPSYAEEENFTVDGETYTVTTIEAEPEAEGSSVTYTGEVTFFNESNMATAALENDSTTQYEGEEFTVQIANNSNVSEFTLVEARNVSAIIADDPEATGVVTDDNGTEFVRFRNGSTMQLSEYLGPPETVTFAVGDEFDYVDANATTTVSAVAPAEATLTWNDPANQSIEFGQGQNITLSGQTYFGYFESNESVQVLPASEYYSQYAGTLSDIDYYHERQNGMWGITLISFLAALVTVSAAYLPNK